MSDREIVDLYWSRSERALEETERQYGALCRGVALRILGDGEEAAEAVNGTYLRLWNAIPPKRPDSLKAYAAAVCRHLALDMAEKRAAQKRGGTEALAAELDECVPDPAGDPADSLALREALNGFLRSLPERTRIIFLRRYWYACPVAEIAECLHMSESAVTSALCRARKNLKKHLEKEGFIL